ncbi:unnamed protein product, partial [Didymodactylos carnosus]
MVQLLLEYGAVHSVRNLRHNLTPYEESNRDDIKQLFVSLEQQSNNDYDYVEWSVVGNDLIEKRKKLRQSIDLYNPHPNLPHYNYQGLCYRGMRITQNDLDQYKLNHHILNGAFLSTSIDSQVGEMFADEGQQSQVRHTPGDNRALQYSCLSAISIEIELEECEDPNDNKNERESGTTSRTSPFLSSYDDIKNIEEYEKPKQRKCRLYGIIGFLLLAIIIPRKILQTDDVDHQLPLGCPNILNRSTWNARPYISRLNLTTFPIKHILIKQLSDFNS